MCFPGSDDSAFRPPEAELDEYHHKATRTLFIGNLDVNVAKEELRKFFSSYGHIIVSRLILCSIAQSWVSNVCRKYQNSAMFKPNKKMKRSIN